MALWKEPDKSPTPPTASPSSAARLDNPPVPEKPAPSPSPAASAEPTPARPASGSESHIAPDLVIEGKIEGAGHVRIAGRFKGDINVRGDVTIEHAAKVDGSIRAQRVTIGGELAGNIEAASHVELLQTGALIGDVKSSTFSVAKGSKMRGQAEFGWEDVTSGATGSSKNGSSRHGTDHNA